MCCRIVAVALLGVIESIAISYVPQSDEVSLHEPVLVGVRIKNTGPTPVVGDLGLNSKGNFIVTVTAPGGTITSDLLHRPPRGMASIGRISLEPEAEWVGELILNEWFAFDAVGLYRVGIDLRGGFTTLGREDVDVVASGTFEVEVTPRNAERLREVCEGLRPVIESEPLVQRWYHAALTLSYLADPVGVECMGSVLSKTHRADSLLLEGLYRIGGEEAREVLARAADGEGERAAKARAYLGMLETEHR